MVTNNIEDIRYKIIKNMGDEFIRLVRIGLISSHLLAWVAIYESFVKQNEKDKKTEAAKTVAAQYEISSRQVFIIIKYMES